ncbi:hypothetical protein CTI12_AA340690 [Artemisia annua]|uniref:Retrotransposon Copia-like N-terminal domain-containing protein n=1 Tax=Artemisia annua TaxID=35608 RepID=A0A2U1MUB7_ARTAN|nr:hypothetical protein CTI12_AA340690 [Artemisia annua]
MANLNTNLHSTTNNSSNPFNSNQNTMNNQDSGSQNMANDPLYLASSDHPGMMLTNTAFNGGNFLGWSRTIKMALGAKLKLGFIDGSSPKPPLSDVNHQTWVRCDYMVTCWILNSMIAELTDSFLYAQLAFDLWKELEERYGQSNGPLIYHIERELSKVSQGNLSVAAYFNKLKRFWDELHSLNGVPVCSCGKMRECSCGITDKFLEIDSRSKLMQFLMKLNDEFESVRNQILSMDPLPNLNKAYYIFQQVEKQKQVTHQVGDPTAFFANYKNGQRNSQDDMSITDVLSLYICEQDIAAASLSTTRPKTTEMMLTTIRSSYMFKAIVYNDSARTKSQEQDESWFEGWTKAISKDEDLIAMIFYNR